MNQRFLIEAGLAVLAVGGLASLFSEPDSAQAKDVRYDLGLAFETKGDLPKAIEFFEEIMSVDIGYKDVSQRVDDLRKKNEA